MTPAGDAPQVVLAVDDSRSMREGGCGTFALEAVTLLARALARLEVRLRHCLKNTWFLHHLSTTRST